MATEKRLIDVNKVIDSMQKCLDETTDRKDSVAYFAFESIIECLKQEPTVDAVEVVHGRWVHHYNDSGEPIDDKWYCSECHMCNDHKRTWYCPNCGAKMDGDGNEQTV